MSESDITRRNFIALGAIGAASAALAGAAGCSSNDSVAGASNNSTTETINSSGIVVDPSAVTEVISGDILVVGGGFSGLACAVQAAENGDNVIMLESQQTVGGNGQGVEGTFAVNSRFQKEQGITVEPSVIMQEELGKSQWVVDGLLYKDLIDASAANIEWLVDSCGCQFSGLIDNYPFGSIGGKVNTFHWWAEGAAYVGYVLPMQARLRELGGDIRLSNRALEFSYDADGAVNGVYAIDAFGDLVNYQAKAIVLATGGFANDDRRLVKHGFNLDNLERIGMPGHFGDGINMALAAGCSEFSSVCYLKYNRISHMSEIEMFGPLWAAFAFGGPFLWVNESCERFVDEGYSLKTGNVMTQSAAVHNQDCHCYSLCDKTVYDQQIADTKGLADEWGIDVNQQWEAIIAEGDDGWTADTIEGLAEQAGIDAASFKASVDEYNAACAAGVDSWYGKDPAYMKAITTPPFYLSRMHVAMEGPLGGVQTDRKFHPHLEAGGMLENVFVIGLDGMMLYRDVYPIDVPGSASAECLHGGRVAANEAHKLIAG